MNYIEALKAVEKGYKVRRKTWDIPRIGNIYQTFVCESAFQLMDLKDLESILEEDWYTVKDTFGWDRALKLLEKGHKIRHSRMIPGTYLSWDKDTDELILCNVSEMDICWNPELKDFINDYWEEVMDEKDA